MTTVHLNRRLEPLDKKDAECVWRHLPREVRAAMRVLPGRLIVAGGFCRDTLSGSPAKDIDLFVCNGKQGISGQGPVLAEAFKTRWKARLVATPRAYTVVRGNPHPSVQFIDTWRANTPERIVQDFDFTAVKCAVWWGGQHPVGTCHPRFFPDAMAKRLVYDRPDEAVTERTGERDGSLGRAIRFLRRGWGISADDMGRIVDASYGLEEGKGREALERMNPSDEPPAWPDPTLNIVLAAGADAEFYEVAKAIEDLLPEE